MSEQNLLISEDTVKSKLTHSPRYLALEQALAGRCRVGRRYVVTCMCFVWVPFRDTKYMLLLHFYDIW